MRNLKTYETYSMNETMDMMFFPVDVIAGQKEVYADLMAGLKSKFSEFVDGGTQVIDETVKSLGPKSSEALRNSQKFFGKSPESISYDDVISALEEEGLAEGESFVDKYDRADYGQDEESITSFGHNVKGGLAQKALSVIGGIFGVNLLSFGMLGSFIAGILGLSIGFAPSMIISIVAWVVVHMIRKLLVVSKG
jgi:hypothetical protein